VSKALVASEESFRLLVAGVKDYAIILLDRRARILGWNGGARLIKGYRGHEIVGQRVSRFYTPEDVKRGHPGRLLRRADVSPKRLARVSVVVRSDLAAPGAQECCHRTYLAVISHQTHSTKGRFACLTPRG